MSSNLTLSATRHRGMFFSSVALLQAPPPALTFSGRRWIVKDSLGEAVGPGGNVFDSRNASIDQGGRLVLRITQREGVWTCGEVIGEKPLGYGVYRWVVDEGLDSLPPSAVLGLFTWSDLPDHSHQELDIEASAWGQPGGPTLQFVVQPYEEKGSGKREPFRWGKSPMRLEFTWAPNRAEFVAFAFRDRRWIQVMTWKAEGSRVPPFVDAQPRMSLWLFKAAPPPRGHRIIIRSFTFSARDM